MIRSEMKNCNMILTEKQQKNQHYHLEKLINMNILPVKKYYTWIKEEDQREKQIKALEKHGKQLIMYSGGKYSLEILKQIETFDELVNERRFEMNKLSEGIDFNNLTYQYKDKIPPKYFIRFKGPLIIYNDIKNG